MSTPFLRHSSSDFWSWDWKNWRDDHCPVPDSEEEPIVLSEVSERLIGFDNELIDVNAEILSFCNELGISPPFKIEEDGE